MVGYAGVVQGTVSIGSGGLKLEVETGADNKPSGY